MVSASPPLHDVVGSGHALMEVMKGTAVSVHLSSQLKMVLLPDLWSLNHLLQSLAELEHSGAPMASVSALLTAVMGHETAQMAVMRLDVVSCASFLNSPGTPRKLTLFHLIINVVYKSLYYLFQYIHQPLQAPWWKYSTWLAWATTSCHQLTIYICSQSIMDCSTTRLYNRRSFLDTYTCT